jgi:hypothetical protein
MKGASTAHKYDELSTKVERLHAELERYRSSEPFLCIKHPLVYSVPYFESENALLNEQYRLKKQYADKYRSEADFVNYVMLHERPHRLNAFLDCAKEIPAPLYWELLRDIWVDSENIWQHKNDWLLLLGVDNNKKDTLSSFMFEEERAALSLLPDVVEIYRGCQDHNMNGLSWTTDQSVAQKFAGRWRRKGMVLQRTVKKSDIFAYLVDGGENEVILLS